MHLNFARKRPNGAGCVLALCVFMFASGQGKHARADETAPYRPVPIIFDTDIGNDVDDALALGVIHALQDRGECRLLAVTITKDHAPSASFVDAVNTFYGRGDIPIGMVRDGPTPGPSRFTGLSRQRDNGTLRYPHDLDDASEIPDATDVLRRVLSAQPDDSVVIVQVGFSTNLARLLDSGPDQHSPLNGPDLAARKVRFLSVMAGAFELIQGRPHGEYNIVKDIPAAQRLARHWPTSIIYSGYEIGLAIRFPAASVDKDFAYTKHHPLAEAYQAYNPTPHERPTWDLTSVLWAVRPQRGYFDLSPPGRVRVEDDGHIRFDPRKTGKHRHLIADHIQAVRVREALALLASQPPRQMP